MAVQSLNDTTWQETVGERIPSLGRHEVTWQYRGDGRPHVVVLVVRPRLDPQGEPIAYLLVEREVTLPDDTGFGDTTIILRYQLLSTQCRPRSTIRYFGGAYSQWSNRVNVIGPSIGARGLALDLPDVAGNRIATYLQNQVIEWVKQWPTAMVEPIELAEVHATPENKVRRNRFYEQFGFEFVYSDVDQRTGKAIRREVKYLNTVNEWEKNIEVVPLTDFIERCMAKQREGQQREALLRSLQEEQRAAALSPVSWALRQLWWLRGERLKYLVPIGILLLTVLVHQAIAP